MPSSTAWFERALGKFLQRLRKRATDCRHGAGQTGQVKVFLVEDAPLLRERLEALIASIPGTRVVGHADGAKEAVRAILAERPDVVVLDIHLADGNGFDVLRGLRAAQFAPEIHVLTNYPLDGYRQTAQRLGARGFFDKSTEFDALRATLAARAAPAASS
jgi:DNA-binding NarL/FixJ family response regulator